MSGYPPPPPYGPDAQRAQRAALKTQARLMKVQARMQRDQLRLQRRALRRSSLVGPIIILAVGVVFLLAELGRISWEQSLNWYARWWPAVLIFAGLLLLAEWSFDNAQAQRQPGQPVHVRVLGGGVVFLLILLALVGLSAHGMQHAIDWRDHTFGPGSTQLNRLFGEQHDSDVMMSSPIEPGATLIIHNPHGDVTLKGGSTDGQVHMSVHTQTYAWNDSDAEAKAQRLQPVLTRQGKDIEYDVPSVDGGQADLTIELPRSAAITLTADHGEVDISEMSAPITVSANHGDVGIKEVQASVTLHVNDDDATLTLHSITGPVVIDGRGGDMDITEIVGDLSMLGDFFGSTHVQHINGAIRFQSSRTTFTAVRLDDEFSVSSEGLDASDVLGPVVLRASNKNVTLDRVSGPVDITDRNGSISLTHALPLGPISIQNTHGSVDLGLPQNAGFQLTAQTRNGSMENDFGFVESSTGETHTLSGKTGNGGPAVTISTSDGDVTVRQSSVAPVPPVPPARITPVPQRGTLAPPAPPAPPRPPVTPTPPISRTF